VQKEQEALTRTDIEMFADLKLVLPFDQGQYLLGRHRNGTIYSLKAVSKSIAAKNNQQKMILQEKRMAEMLHVAGRFVPLVLHTFVSPGYLFSVYKVQLVTDLNALMTDPFDEPTAAFYGGCMALAINYLHGEQIIYRSICPESVFINSSGVPQLVDFRNAVRDNGMPLTDICGIEQYLAPEQVGGHGHSLPVDLWALGVLIYEMRCGATPWATGDPKKDTEVGVYSRIMSHGGELPWNESLSPELYQVVNGLLQPNTEMRLGCRGKGFDEIYSQEWFGGFAYFERLSRGAVPSPHKVKCASLESSLGDYSQCLPEEHKYEGDHDWYKGFGDFEGDSSRISGTAQGQQQQQQPVLQDWQQYQQPPVLLAPPSATAALAVVQEQEGQQQQPQPQQQQQQQQWQRQQPDLPMPHSLPPHAPDLPKPAPQHAAAIGRQSTKKTSRRSWVAGPGACAGLPVRPQQQLPMPPPEPRPPSAKSSTLDADVNAIAPPSRGNSSFSIKDSSFYNTLNAGMKYVSPAVSAVSRLPGRLYHKSSDTEA